MFVESHAKEREKQFVPPSYHVISNRSVLSDQRWVLHFNFLEFKNQSSVLTLEKCCQCVSGQKQCERFFFPPVVWGLLLEWWGQEGEVDLQLVAEQREIRECICLPLVATLLMVSEVITLQCDQDGMEMDTAREEEDKKYVHLTFRHIKKLIHQLICWLFPLVWLNWYCIPLLLGLLKSDVII